MLRSLSRLSVNTVSDFMAVHTDTRKLAELPVQNESLCLYAIHNHGFFAPHPWSFIQKSNRTPAVQLLTAVTAPGLIASDILAHEEPIPTTTLAAVIATDPNLYHTLPDSYKTPRIRQLYREICNTKPGNYRWSFGVVAC